MTPERIAGLRTWSPPPQPDSGPDDGRRVWHGLLDEIERLQEAERWRDPAVELPASYVGVLVWIDGGICHAEMRDHADGTRSWGEVDGNTLNVGMFPVLGWRPLPSAPEAVA